MFFLRLVFGVCLFMHGWGKIRNINDLVSHFNVPLPVAWAVAYVQTVGAFAMVLGLVTVPFALALVIVHIVATWNLISVDDEPFVAPSRHSWSIGLLYTVIPLAIALAGPGKYSLDAFLGFF